MHDIYIFTKTYSDARSLALAIHSAKARAEKKFLMDAFPGKDVWTDGVPIEVGTVMS